MNKISILADGYSIEVKYQGTQGDYISHSRILPSTKRQRIRAMLSRTGCVTGIRYVISDFGRDCIIHNSIASNSRQLKRKQASTVLYSHPSAGLKSFVYADEADVLNVAVFGKTAKMWRDENPDREGNIRDEATLRQLIVLVNLESMNSELIKLGLSKPERAVRLNQMAIDQMRILENDHLHQLE